VGIYGVTIALNRTGEYSGAGNETEDPKAHYIGDYDEDLRGLDSEMRPVQRRRVTDK
jgi:hypothetical protein